MVFAERKFRALSNQNKTREGSATARPVSCQTRLFTCYLSNPKKEVYCCCKRRRGELCFCCWPFSFREKKRIVTLAEPAEPRSVDAVARVCLHSGSSVQCRAWKNQNRGQIHNSKSLKKKAGREILFPCRVSLDCSTVRPTSSSPSWCCQKRPPPAATKTTQQK